MLASFASLLGSARCVRTLLLVSSSCSSPARRRLRGVARGTRSRRSATFLVTGHGWGHGVGLSQYGAYGYAQKGVGYEKIVLHYFAGTELGAAPVSRVRVLLDERQCPRDDRVGTDSRSVTEPARCTTSRGEVHAEARAQACSGRTDDGSCIAGPPALPAGRSRSRSSTAIAARSRSTSPGKLRAINMVGLEQYLYGVVPSEMPFTWLPEALKAQAVVARSYALATRRTGAFDLYPDTRSQVYLGIEHEKPSTNAAVDATAGKVVLYQGEVAKTFFFSTSGGRTASAEDVWGKAVPYLVSVADPYDSISPHHDWGPFVFTGAKLAKMMKMTGRVVDLQPELNSSGRIKTLNVVGTKSTVAVQGADLRRRLGLRSTWFSVGVLSLTAPPQTVIYGARALNGVARGSDARLELQQFEGTGGCRSRG